MNRDIKTIYHRAGSAILLAMMTTLAPAQTDQAVQEPVSATPPSTKSTSIFRQYNAVLKKKEAVKDEYFAASGVRMPVTQSPFGVSGGETRAALYDAFVQVRAEAQPILDLYQKAKKHFQPGEGITSCEYLSDQMRWHQDPGKTKINALLKTPAIIRADRDINEIWSLYTTLQGEVERESGPTPEAEALIGQLDARLDQHREILRQVRAEAGPKSQEVEAYFNRMRQGKLLIEANARNCIRSM